MDAACNAAGAKEVFITTDQEEGELFIAARRAAFPAIEARGSILLEDVGAPVPKLPELLAGIAAVAERNAVEVPVVAHAGDGNTHPIIVFKRGDPAGRERAYLAFNEIMHLAIELGGTITGEHGVGRAKKAALPDQLGPDVMALSHKIKNVLDPLGILNPGAIL
jgi:glycolate oxidase